jgi:TPR repeat protein
MNNPCAICDLGFCYDTGYGIKQNMEKAVNYYIHACKLHSIAAFFNLTICYYYGDGVSQDFE